MSIYSGFATRQQEHKYNNLIETLIIALKKRIQKFYLGDGCDEGKFKLLVKKIYKKMFVMEKGKFMAPKYSSCFTDLIDFLHIEINYDTMSECSSSIMSQTFSLRKDSGEQQGDHLKSNALLNNKRNLLEVKANKALNSTLSLSKNHLLSRMDNQEDQFKKQFIPRSTSLDPGQDSINRFKASKKKLGELKNLKQMRGTMNMPKVEDFLPKKEQMQPVFNLRRNTFMDKANLNVNQSPNQQSKVVFRRQKYSKAEVRFQDV